MAANWISGLHASFATVRQTNAAHVSALDALERNFTAETAILVWQRHFIPQLKRSESIEVIKRCLPCL